MKIIILFLFLLISLCLHHNILFASDSTVSITTSSAIPSVTTSAASNIDVKAKKGKIKIVISVDWEGDTLDEKNLAAFNKFRETFPKIKIQHFLNPAYFLRAVELGLTEDEINKRIRSVLREGDEEGLHIHAWKELIEKSGVEYKDLPSFSHDYYGSSSGSLVPLWAYSQNDLKKIFSTAIEIQKQYKFKAPTSFRAGGWQATTEVMNALAESGITLDCSALPSSYSLPGWEKLNLKEWVNTLWPMVTSLEQPFIIKDGKNEIIELPNNGHLADYVSAVDMFESFKKLSEQLTKEPSKDLYLSIGFHQETAAAYIKNIITAIILMNEYADKKNISYEFTSFPFHDLKTANDENELSGKKIISSSIMQKNFPVINFY
ncbi:MAG: hypothetical protein HQK51_04150 [Oligoflexia bacterium]|nr:hypothetical protein [Oligoflexia bacterium]